MEDHEHEHELVDISVPVGYHSLEESESVTTNLGKPEESVSSDDQLLFDDELPKNVKGFLFFQE